MTIKSSNECIGCDECVKSCPREVICMDLGSGNALITHPELDDENWRV